MSKSSFLNRIGLAALIAIVTVAASQFLQANEQPALRVDDSGHYLVRGNNTPFFWLGDTAWELFHRLNREEASFYLEDRAKKGFTVIQAVVLAELDGLREPNAYGDLPLIDLDPTKPNEAYFKHVDSIVRKANALGLTLGMLPTWGDKVKLLWGRGPVVFTAENARVYGEFLGQRYKNDDVVWILGGDRPPKGDEEIWAALAKGLRAGDEGRHLITGHFSGGSAAFFHEKPWLDFNLAYSGHHWAAPTYKDIARDYVRKPAKPVIDGEPRYENHPYIADGSSFYGNQDRWDRITRGNAQQMRQAAYWAMLAGAAGHTYGCHDIWQMYDKQREGITYPNTFWRQALDFPGSKQMGIMRQLLESKNWQSLRPDASVIIEGQGPGQRHIQAAVARDGSCLLAYIPLGQKVTVRMDAIKSEQVHAQWFDPRTGAWLDIGTFLNTEQQTFEPSHSGPTWDWVLVLDHILD